jgi:hypothetical protein
MVGGGALKSIVSTGAAGVMALSPPVSSTVASHTNSSEVPKIAKYPMVLVS